MSQHIETLPNHNLIDDVQGLSVGTFLCAYGTIVLGGFGLITGQSAGLALLLSHMTGWGFGILFFLTSLPFYLFAIPHFGWRFILKSLISIVGLSLMVDALGPLITPQSMPVWVGLLVFSTTVGLGLLATFRHGASLGGLGVMAIYLQDRYSIRAGYTQMAVDAVIFGVAMFVLPGSLVAYSLAGALILSVIIAFNHRRDWYVAR